MDTVYLIVFQYSVTSSFGGHISFVLAFGMHYAWAPESYSAPVQLNLKCGEESDLFA